MIKVIDQAALTLLDPTEKMWDVHGLINNYPQALNYVDGSTLSGYDWYFILKSISFVKKDLSYIVQLCTEYGGWGLMGGREWSWLLFYEKMFSEQCIEFSGWDMMDKVDWDRLLSRHPQFKKYRK